MDHPKNKLPALLRAVTSPYREDPLPARLLRESLEALRAFRFADLSASVSRARISLSARDFLLRFVSPLFQEIGHLVENKRLIMAQEHAFSAMMRNQLAEIHRSLPKMPPGPQSMRLAIASPEGDLHEFGILIASILASMNRIPVLYLGANVSLNVLIDSVVSLNASHVLLGTVPCAGQKYSRELYIGQLDRSLPTQIELWVGGGPPLTLATLLKERSARFFPSLEELDLFLEELA